MSMESYTLQPKRIKEGRLFRGLTQESLADAISVTKQAVSQYETGVLTPTLEIITQIADVLDFPQQYFSKPYRNEILTPVFFRKRKTSTKKLTELFQTYIEWMADIYAYIEQYIHLPELSLLTYDKVGYTRKEISNIAKSPAVIGGLATARSATSPYSLRITAYSSRKWGWTQRR